MLSCAFYVRETGFTAIYFRYDDHRSSRDGRFDGERDREYRDRDRDRGRDYDRRRH